MPSCVFELELRNRTSGLGIGNGLRGLRVDEAEAGRNFDEASSSNPENCISVGQNAKLRIMLVGRSLLQRCGGIRCSPQRGPLGFVVEREQVGKALSCILQQKLAFGLRDGGGRRVSPGHGQSSKARDAPLKGSDLRVQQRLRLPGCRLGLLDKSGDGALSHAGYTLNVERRGGVRCSDDRGADGSAEAAGSGGETRSTAFSWRGHRRRRKERRSRDSGR
jgi:hypothetical protein